MLQDHEFARVGGAEIINADVRVVAASRRLLRDYPWPGNVRAAARPAPQHRISPTPPSPALSARALHARRHTTRARCISALVVMLTVSIARLTLPSTR